MSILLWVCRCISCHTRKTVYPYNFNKHLSPVFYFLICLHLMQFRLNVHVHHFCTLLRSKGKFSGWREPTQICIMKKLDLSFISDILDSKLRNWSDKIIWTVFYKIPNKIILLCRSIVYSEKRKAICKLFF